MTTTLKKPVTVYKKLIARDRRTNIKCDAVATLLLPKGTLINKRIQRSAELETIGDYKNRASKAKVVCIDVFVRDERGCQIKRRRRRAFSAWDTTFIYRVGKTVRPVRDFNLTRETCASGIHFFQTYNKARWY